MEHINNIPNVFVLPRGSVLPADSSVKPMTVTNMREFVLAVETHTDTIPIGIIFESMDLLSVLIKHQDIVPWVPSTLVGVSGGEYDVMFEQVTFPLDKVSYDILENRLKGRREKPVERKARDLADLFDEATLIQRSEKTAEQFGPDAESEA